MTVPKIATVKRGGSRFYVDPDDSDIKVPGVTSIISMLPKDFLQYWSAKKVAECAVEELGTIVQMTLNDPSAAIDHLKKAPTRDTRKAADLGTIVHGKLELIAQGKPVGRVTPEIQSYLDHFDEFLRVCNPEYIYLEETVWSDKYQYAGSFDAYAEVDGERVFIDNKTTRSGIHEEVGIQLAAYRFAEHILRQDGSRVPNPGADGGAVLHIRPEGWQFVPVRADEQMFEVFLHLRQVFDYERELKRTIIGKPIAEGPEEQETTGPKRTTARRRS